MILVPATILDVISRLVVATEWIVIGSFLAINSFYALLLVSAAVQMRHHRIVSWHRGLNRLLSSPVAPRVSVLSPAYNEEATVIESTRALLTLSYPQLEVVIVNDGSPDATLDVLKREFDLVPVHAIFRRRIETKPVRGIYRSRSTPSLVVVDKENGGKADALNAGLNVCGGELVCAIDADTLLEPDALLRLAHPFLARGDGVVAGGTIRLANGSAFRDGRVLEPRVPRNPLAGAQTIEYLRAFLFGRLGWNRLGGNLIVSGAFGLFRREAMLDIGGYHDDTVGEDMALVVQLRRHGVETGGPDQVEFVPDPVAWTEAPERVRVLARQRNRWQRGLFDVLWRNRTLLYNPRYGALGLLVYPYFLFVELLGPLVELIGVIGLIVAILLDAVDWPFAMFFFLVAYGYGLLLSGFTLVLAEASNRPYARIRDRFVLLAWTVVESVGYRQATVVWRLDGMLGYLRGSQSWGTMTRRGFSPSTPATPRPDDAASSGRTALPAPPPRRGP